MNQALQLFLSSVLISFLSISAHAQFGEKIQYFSQVGVNGGSTTSFTINNPSGTETITVDAQLYFPDGTPLADGQVELARIDHRFGNEGDFGRPERFSESFAIDPVQVE